MKLKILSIILSIILTILLSGDSQKHTYIHIEVPNKFIAEYENNMSEK